MANNKMRLECLLCHDSLYLAKYYPTTGWYLLPSEIDFSKLSEFLDKHSPCVKRDKDGNFDPNGKVVEHGNIIHQDQRLFGQTFSLVYD